MTDTAVAGNFNHVGQVAAANQWQAPGLATALAPAVNADRSLNYQTAQRVLDYGGAGMGSAYNGLPLVHNTTDVATSVSMTALASLRSQVDKPGQNWKFDDALGNLLIPAMSNAIANVRGSQTAPWFGWGATSATSTTYNSNLLVMYPASYAAGYLSTVILSLAVTVNLSQQQVLALPSYASATYTVTAQFISSLLPAKLPVLF